MNLFAFYGEIETVHGSKASKSGNLERNLKILFSANHLNHAKLFTQIVKCWRKFKLVWA